MKNLDECLVLVKEGDFLVEEYTFAGTPQTDTVVVRFTGDTMQLKDVVGKGEVMNTMDVLGDPGIDVLTNIRGKKVALLDRKRCGLPLRRATSSEKRQIISGLKGGALRISHE